MFYTKDELNSDVVPSQVRIRYKRNTFIDDSED